MPTIKQFTRTKLPTELVNVQASARSFGGEQSGLRAQAAALDASGRGMQQLAQTVEGINRKRQENDYYAKLAEFELSNSQRADELKNANFEDDSAIATSYGEDIEQRASELEIPPVMRDRWVVDLARMKTSFTKIGAKEQSRRYGEKAGLNFENTLTSSVNMVTLDPDKIDEAMMSMSGLVDSLNIPDVDKKVFKDQALDSIKLAQLNTIAQKDPYGFKARAEKGEFNDVEKLPNLIALADKRIKESLAQEEKQAADQRGVEESRIDLELAMADSVSEFANISARIDTLETQYGEEWANDYRTKLVKASKKKDEKTDYISMGAKFAIGQEQLNPKDNEHRKAADEYYKSFISNPAFAEATDQEKNTYITKMVSQTKYVPDTLKGEMLNWTRSNNPEDLERATDLLDKVKVINHYLLDQFGDTVRLDSINSYIDAGLPVAQAINKVDEQMNPINTPREQQIKEEITNAKIDFRAKAIDSFSGFEDWVAGFFGGGLQTESSTAIREMDFAAADYRSIIPFIPIDICSRLVL